MFLATFAVSALHVVAFDVAELVSGPPLAARGAWNVLSRFALVLTAAGCRPTPSESDLQDHGLDERAERSILGSGQEPGLPAQSIAGNPW
jgi:hypothetical protein